VNLSDAIDARAVAPHRELTADVCIVGAGAAGIVLALRLAAAGCSTLLLEAGGLEEDPWTADLFDGPNLGLPYLPLSECRAHRFGGTTYKYGGYSKPVAPRDFAPVPGVPLATWPLTFDDLAPWLVVDPRSVGQAAGSRVAGARWLRARWGRRWL
jgi:choline dehydrogenase-like flavoprotein